MLKANVIKKDGFMYMAKKYLKGGALNPAWCDEQDAEYYSEKAASIVDDLGSIFENILLELQLGEGVGITVSKNRNQNEMCTIVDKNDYEAKFNFIKNHSSTPEDLELAMKIVGLK